MTKVQLHYDLVRRLEDSDASAISNIHGYYGIVRVQIDPTLKQIDVEYDASRLTESDVENVLVRYGIPIQRLA